MRFPLILQMDFSATYCLIPGFVISFLIGHYQLRGRNRWGTIAVSLGLYLLFETLWQVVERRWSDVWVLILGTLALSCLLGFLAAWAWGKAPGQGTQHRLSDPKTETESPRVLLTRGFFLACQRVGSDLTPAPPGRPAGRSAGPGPPPAPRRGSPGRSPRSEGR